MSHESSARGYAGPALHGPPDRASWWSVIVAANSSGPNWASIVALVVSLFTFAWSTAWAVYTWRRTGEALRVRGNLRLPLFQAGGGRPVRSGQAFGVLTITARNRGRAPVQVHRLFLASKDTKKRSTFQLGDASDPLPVTIEARNRAQWYVPPQTLGVLTKTFGNPLVVRPLIEWGPGNWKRGRILRIRVGEEHLPGRAPRFRSTLTYRLRTWRRRTGVGPLTPQVGSITVSTTSPGPNGGESRPPAGS